MNGVGRAVTLSLARQSGATGRHGSLAGEDVTCILIHLRKTGPRVRAMRSIRPSRLLGSDPVEGVSQIVLEILDILDTHGQAHQSV